MSKRPKSQMPRVARKKEYSMACGQYLDVAFKDYIAARVLLLQGLLPQGAVLASTAVEKYLKAILAFNGQESHGHLKTAHRRAAVNFDPRFSDSLDKGFLELLQRCFRLRYLDQLPKHFNLVIASREFLAELDDVATLIDEGFRLDGGDGMDLRTGTRAALKRGDERFTDNNFVVGRISKNEFIAAEDQAVYEIRIDGPGEWMEAHYTSKLRRSDRNFLRSALVPVGRSYQFSLPPIKA